jgi:hypothetical protein
MSGRTTRIRLVRHGLALLAWAGIGQGGMAWRAELYPEDWVPPQHREGLNFLTDEMVQDFSYAGYHRGERAIPDVAGPVYNVLDYGADPAGQADATDAIQAAIHAAERDGGGVVYMPEGTYSLSKPANRNYAIRITRSQVVLRGAGPDKTFLVNTTTSMRSSRVIRFTPAGGANWGTPRGGTVLLAKDYPGPTREIELEDWLNFQVGDWIVVHNPFTDQVDEAGSFVQDIRMDGSLSAVPSWLGQGGTLGGPMMYRQITAVDAQARKLWLDAPTRWYLLRRDGARVYRVDDLLEEVGMEGFSIGNLRHPSTEFMTENHYSNPDRAAYEMHDSWLLSMERVRNGWVRDLRSFDPGNSNGVHMLSNGLVLDWSRGVTVERVEMQRAQYGGGGGNGYMIRLNSVNEVLVRNSRVAYCRHGILIWRMQNSGNVLHRNLDEFTGVQTSNTGSLQNTSGRASDHHGLFSHSNLFDRHVVNQSFVEAAFRGTSGTTPHAQSSSQSLYWNSEGKSYYSGRAYIVHSEQAGRGYVIGTRGAVSGAINTPKLSGSDRFTDPVDRLEGIGMGDTLEPASLYEDQLRRRFGREGITHPPQRRLPAPLIEVEPSAQTVRVQAATDFGRNYQLLQSADLTPDNWNEAGDPRTGNGALVDWSGLELPQQGGLFLRVVGEP